MTASTSQLFPAADLHRRAGHAGGRRDHGEQAPRPLRPRAYCQNRLTARGWPRGVCGSLVDLPVAGFGRKDDHVCVIARQRAWPVITSDPGRLRRVNPDVDVLLV